jgi:hypothetical protein
MMQQRHSNEPVANGVTPCASSSIVRSLPWLFAVTYRSFIGMQTLTSSRNTQTYRSTRDGSSLRILCPVSDRETPASKKRNNWATTNHREPYRP